MRNHNKIRRKRPPKIYAEWRILNYVHFMSPLSFFRPKLPSDICIGMQNSLISVFLDSKNSRLYLKKWWICVSSYWRYDRSNWQSPVKTQPFYQIFRSEKFRPFCHARNRTFKLQLMEHLLTETLLVGRIRLKFDAIRLPGDSFCRLSAGTVSENLWNLRRKTSESPADIFMRS